MLNLVYAREAGRLGSLLAASGACLSIGFLHTDRMHRPSLVYDALDPLRPLIDARAIRFIRGHQFEKGDFHLLSDGHVRLAQGLIKVILDETMLPQNDVDAAAAFMLSLIRKHSPPNKRFK